MTPVKGKPFTLNTRKPLIWPIVHAAFPAAVWDGDPAVIVTWGKTTYCAQPLPQPLIAHETVHQHQQRNKLWGLVWWALYILSPRFRFNQELEAHRAEYLSVQTWVPYGNQRDNTVHQIVTRLSGPLYNNIVSYDEAMKLITRT